MPLLAGIKPGSLRTSESDGDGCVADRLRRHDPELVLEIARRSALQAHALRKSAEVAIEMHESELRPLVEQLSERGRCLLIERVEGLDPVTSEANFIVVRPQWNRPGSSRDAAARHYDPRCKQLPWLRLFSVSVVRRRR